MSKATRRLILVMLVLASGAALAHPGHGEAGANTTLLHLLTEPDHLLALLAVVGVGIAAVAAGRGERDSRRADRRKRGD